MRENTHERGRHAAAASVLRRPWRGTELSACRRAAVHHAARAVDRHQAARTSARRHAVHPHHPRSRADRAGAAWLPTGQQRVAWAGRGRRRGGRTLRWPRQPNPARLSHRHRAPTCCSGIVRHFEAAYPDVTVEPTSSTSLIPQRAWPTARTEVALIRSPVDLPDHRMFILDWDDWVACLPRDHRLADRAEVEIAELLDDPIVCAPLTAPARGATTGWRWRPAAAGRRPSPRSRPPTRLKPPTSPGVSGSVSPPTSVSRLYDRPGIAYVPIRDRPPATSALAWNPEGVSPQA